MNTPTIYDNKRFFEVPLTSIRTEGYLREFLQRQLNGLTGHFSEQGYPYDTCLWRGIIPAFYQETEYNGMSLTIPDEEQWWSYEQSAYLLDGLVRIGLLMNRKDLVDIFLDNISYLQSNVQANGRLGGQVYGHSSEWPMAVLFKGIAAYLKTCPSKETINAFHRHYSVMSEADLADDFRHITNIEGVLEIARLTGDVSLRNKAFAAYTRFNKNVAGNNSYCSLTFDKICNLDNPVFHGVTLCEEIKIPVLLYLAGGDISYLRAAESGWKKVMANHGQISGVPCSVEYGFGRDPNQGYETCVIADSLYTLGYFLMAESKCCYADQMEKIAFNALPGAVTEDFSALQYLSAPNQVIATGFSHSSSYLRGQAAFRQYRPDHFPACCSGNVHRAMPNYISRMWMVDGDGSPVASLYGPSEYCGKKNGHCWKITEDTEYPFNEEIRFTFSITEGQLNMPFIFRVPEWCSKATVSVNGEKAFSLAACSGTYMRWERKWQDGDMLVLKLPMEAVQKYDRQWTWFECGPLVYSLDVKHTSQPEKSTVFPPLRMEPLSAWAYAVSPNTLVQKVIAGKENADSYPFAFSRMNLNLEAYEVSGRFAELEQQRYTPSVPIDCTVGKKRKLTLVPMGCTRTRLTAFPDGVIRQYAPMLSAVVKEVDTSDNSPIAMRPMEFRAVASEIQADFSEYFDLAKFFNKTKNCQAYLQIRFWSDVDTDGILAAIASDGAIGYFNGIKVLEISTIMDAESMEMLWFPVHVAKGHNYLLLKVIDSEPSPQHRDAWGAKVKLFFEDDSAEQ